MVRRNAVRLGKLEERSDERQARRAERDEREEEHEAVMEEMHKTPEGREAIARLGDLYVEHGDLEAFRHTDEGLEAVRSFRDELFAAQDRLREEQKGDDELGE